MKLYSYQTKAIEWLAKRRYGLIALDMGLGKTAVAITAANQAEISFALIVCPKIAVENWRRELNLWKANFLYYVVSYSSVHKFKQTCPIDLLILDESHYVKSPRAKRTCQIFGKNGVARQSQRVWCLSGTPAPNHAAELWVCLYLFGVTNLHYSEFVDRYCTHRLISKRHLQITGTKKNKIEELKELMRPIILRETAESVKLELPPIIYETVAVEENKVDFNGDEWERLAYEANQLKDFMRAREEQGEDFLSIGTHVATLRRYNGLRKIKSAIELVTEELNEKAYEKIVIFAHHREVVEEVSRGLGIYGAVSVLGGIDDKQRQDAIDNFQTNPAVKVLIANIQTAGIAINLTAANQILFIEQDWVPGNNAQAIKRCHRIGTTKPLYVRYLVLAGDTLDEKITSTLKRKTEELTSLFSPP